MRKIITILSLILFAGVSMAQEVFAPAFKMTKEPMLGAKIYLEPSIITGDKLPFDLDSLLQSNLKSGHWVNMPSGKALRMDKHWRYMKFYSLVDHKAEADVVIKPSLNYVAQSEMVDKRLCEFKGRGGVKIPFKEIRATNSLNATLLLQITRKNKSAITDTIVFHAKSELKKGKRLIPITEMNERFVKYICLQLYDLNHFAKCEMFRFRFPKVKVKDKDLKDALKTVQSLLNEAKLSEVANIYRKIIERQSSPEAHLCLGMCYEIAGDYQKAQEEYKHKADFHIKTRMKYNMQVYNYFKSIGIRLLAIEI
ncbi:tetratricopeptide repeat protein [Marinifilum sp.]|uniref:tetratricopeptide repeat protein n=1 Tax=Marinifilum sp. TaxID=2033137 RepID=UPI003BAA19A3